MTRRDIIIVAVLANMGILAVLFMLAFRLEDQKMRDSSEIAFEISSTPSNGAQEIEIDVTKYEDDDNDDSDALIEEAIPLALAAETEQEEDLIQFKEVETEKVPAVVPVTSQDSPSSNPIQVTVKKGDVLEKIAKAHGTTVDAIMKLNYLKSDKLKIGQKLNVPVNTRKPMAEKQVNDKAAQTSRAAATSSNQPQFYTVKSGDNPWKIAKQFNLKVDDLLRLNNLNEESARNMKIGDQVRVK